MVVFYIFLINSEAYEKGCSVRESFDLNKGNVEKYIRGISHYHV
jgi:hypothetical protein